MPISPIRTYFEYVPDGYTWTLEKHLCGTTPLPILVEHDKTLTRKDDNTDDIFITMPGLGELRVDKHGYMFVKLDICIESDEFNCAHIFAADTLPNKPTFRLVRQIVICGMMEFLVKYCTNGGGRNNPVLLGRVFGAATPELCRQFITSIADDFHKHTGN